ncbi:non-ribosomal peptide synthetase [Burkholderia sp. ABCPW 111]|uniref:non-ribosomal peptide synthetase n=1 Tax=Burkholderia sp. ABCPW 111 TaxID=1820025 RepID=UPI0005313524|nr:non-ribosomal peptide synthetase [Burkholderia sp. ABCPW 111]KGS05275.1 D-alanine--poly(phosphoribitol) ligase, subunit 1 [Burkholderia sp. ABCPW 111]
MNIVRLMADLADAGITLRRRDDRLHVEGPPGALDGALVSRLRDAKDALLAMLDDDASRAPPLPPPLPGEGGDAGALSPGQARLVAATRLGDPAMYNEQMAIELADAVDSQAIGRAFVALARRHDILRTVFVGGEPMQQTVLPEPVVQIERMSVDGDGALRARAAEVARLPFAAGRPLWRIDLFSTPERPLVLVLTIHHAIFDRWSMSVLIRDFSAYLASPDESDAPGGRLSYRDFAAWQRRWMETPDYAAQLDAWLEALADLDEVPAIRGDRPRASVPSWRGGTERVEIPADCIEAAAAFSRTRNTTLFTTLFSMFALLLHRYTGDPRVVALTPAANRPFQAAEDIAGYFVNLIALATSVRDDDSFSSLVERMREATARAFAHQGVPLDAIVDRLRARGGPQHDQFAQTAFAFQNVRLPAVRTASGTATPFDLDSPFARFDLYLSIEGDERGMFAVWQYNADLFDAETVCRLGAHYVALLRAALASPEANAHALPMLSNAERAQLLVDFNATRADFSHGVLIHQLFEAQVQLTPDATAVVFEDRALSYAELNRRANRLAHHLIALGVRPDDRVAICTGRGLETVVGLLGVLKAGGAYVPLDPAYPAARLAYMLDDAAPVAVLTTAALADELAFKLPTILLDAQNASFQSQSNDNPDTAALGLTSCHLAYVIYTSGSTGQPKGVMVEHDSLVNLIQSNWQHFSGVSHARTSCWTSFGFDVSVFEIFISLAMGGAVHIVPDRVRISADGFFQWLIAQRIAIAYLPPFLVRRLREYPDELVASLSLRRILVGVEPLREKDLYRLERLLPELTVVNGYGPTETTVFSTCYLDMREYDRAAPIGRPIANTRIYILDSHGQSVPIGVAGEIHIAGAGVARGYLNRPELTAERFVSDPFAAATNARMYKTGDLGRWLPDGTIEYRGRNDFQVKVRGFRIELGEIEARLARCDGVRDAVVIAREDTPGDKRLVAYVLPQSGVALVPGELRRQLAGQLAEYMLPSAFVILDALPLTPNGKLDREALPAPDLAAVASRGYEAPTGEVETALARIWQDLLGLEQVGRNDHFFELGGHSMLVVSMIERLRSLGWSLDVRSLFLAPVLADLARAIDTRRSDATAFVVPPNRIPNGCGAITPAMLPLVALSQAEIDAVVDAVPGGAANVQDIYPLAPLQEGILFHHLQQTQGDAYLLRSLLAFDTRARLDAFLAALQQVIDRHDILRTAACWKDLAQPVQVVWRQAALHAEIFSPAEEGHVPTQLLRHTDPRARRLDLSRAPLFALDIAHDPERGEWLLALTFHHLIADHLTLELIVAEITAILHGQAEALPAALPYRNFIAQVSSVPADVHETYFREVLGDVDEPTAPFGVLEARDDGKEITEAHLALADDLARAIRNQARRLGMSPGVLFHVGWAQVLVQTSGRDDVVFGSVLLGRLRELAGADRVMGVLINTLPVRICLAERSVQEVVQAAYHGLTGLLEHEQAPLSLVQRCSGVVPPLPLFSTLLNYRHSTAGIADGTWEGMRQLHSEERTTYPVTLSVDDLGEGFGLTAQTVAGIDPARMAAYLATAMRGLVEALAAEPQRPILSLSILSREEERCLIHDLNATPPEGDGYLLHAGIERHAALTPLAPAVICAEGCMQYRELAAETRRVAGAVVAAGARREPVAVLLPRSVGAIAAYSGVMRAGCAYVPIDPATPPERMRDVLATLNYVLTTRELAAALDGIDARVILVDEAAPADVAPPTVALGDLAYVMFTSGSTGKPKGVMIDHRSASLTIESILRRYAIGPADRLLCVSSVGFDLSVFDFFGAFAAGAAVVLAPESSNVEPHVWLDLMERERATVWESVPAVMELLLLECRNSRRKLPPSLKLVMLSGDRVPVNLPARIREAATSELHVIALGGATEAAIWSCYYDTRHLPPDASFVPYGRHLPGQRLYVLSSSLRPLPIGVPGDLWIAGAGVARGYLGQPDLTAYRFVDDPHVPGERMYRTGDRARVLADGNLEFLGRVDDQVKIRGFRIEIGEIEAALGAAPGVERGVATIVEHNGRQTIAAYVVARADAVLDHAEIRDALARRLPPYMLPASIVSIDSVPLTRNGKIDRRALMQVRAQTSPAEGPRNAVEKALASIWQVVLGREAIDVHENFFDAGGDSMLAIRIVTRAREQRIHIMPRDVLQLQTIAKIAAAAGAASDVVEPDGETAAPLPPMARWFFLQQPREPDWFHQSVLLQVPAQTETSAIRGALETLVTIHEALRTAYFHEEGEWRQRVIQRVKPVFETVKLAVAEDDAIDEAADRLRASIRIEHAALLSAGLLEFPDDSRRLLLIAHHLAVDAVSWQIIIDQIASLCAGNDLGAVPTTMRRWTRRRIDWAAAAPAGLIDELLGGAASSESLPLDGTDEAGDVAASGEQSCALDRATTSRIISGFAAAEGYRIDEVTAAVVAGAIMRWSGRHEVVIDLESHGRNGFADDPEVPFTVGWFTTIMPTVIRGGTFKETLQSVRAAIRSSSEHGADYQALHYLKGRADWSPRPLLFNFLGRLEAKAGEWRLLRAGIGSDRAPSTPRSHLLDIGAAIIDGSLNVSIEYNPRAHRDDTIASLLDDIRTTLDELGSRTALGDSSSIDVEDVYPLTPMQEGMLYHALGGDGMYVEQLTCTLAGAVNEQALRSAWSDVVASNPVLRTSFHWEGVAQPVQIVHTSVSVPWQQESWPRGLDLDAWLRADRERGLDLRAAPCLRCALLKTDEDRWELVVTYSHLLLDGWSLSLLIGELVRAYAARVAGDVAQRPPRSPFSGYVAWSRSIWEQGAGEGFWRAELGDFEGTRELVLPTPLPDGEDGAPVTVEVDRGALEALEKRERVTLASVVAGCWAVLLSRYGASDDVLFGMTSSGRRAEVSGSESMVGVLIETRPARIKVDGQAPLGAWLRSVMQAEARREEAGAVSLAQIEGWGEAERGTRLFDTLVVVENYPMAKPSDLLGGGIGVVSVRAVERTNWPLTVVAVPEGGRLKLTLLYDPARYERASIEQVAGHLARLLSAAAQAATVGDLAAAMLDDTERETLLVHWSGGDQVLPPPCRTIVERIDEQALARPQATALRLGDRRLSYAELTARGRRMAAWLQGQGVGVGGRVAIVGERTMETIAAMYGILASGAAYVPLDPDWPDERKALVIEDAQPLMVIGGSGAWCGAVRQVELGELEVTPDAALTPCQATVDDLAYVIYTSGSTGRPKGVMVRHGDVMHLDGLRERMELSETDVWTAFHSYAFDYSILEIWYPLMTGATVVPVPYWVTRSPEAFHELLRTEGATIVCQTPAAFQQLVAVPHRGVRLRWAVVGGETYHASLPASADPAQYPRIANVYGITETTVITTFEPLGRGQPVTIGRPFPGQRIYLLDRHGRLVPPGAVGEIHVAGEGIAAGYLGAQALTAQRFVADPYRPGERMYRSGDLGRFLPGGRMESLGRADRQIKIRGYRIELGEIECALSSLEGIGGAVADVREGASGRQLVAWYAAAADVDAQRVRTALKQRLPDSMMPSALIRVDGFALTANGKIDRRALPRESAPTAPAQGPRNALEEALAAIWCEVLGREAIGVDENFFDAGGDSLAIVRAHGLMSTRLPRAESLRVVDLFQQPTIAAIASQIAAGETRQATADEPDERALRRRRRTMERRQKIEREHE